MYFALNPDQLARQAAVRDFAATHCTESTVRSLMATPLGFDANAWKVLADEPGLVGGGGLVDTVAVLEVLGQHLYCGPVLSSVLAAQVLAALSSDDPASTLLASLVAGTSIVAVVRPRPTEQIIATDRSGEVLLDGTVGLVLDGALADQLLVAAADGAWYVVAGDAPGLERTPRPTLDQTRKLAALSLQQTPARRLILVPDGPALLARLDLVEQIAIAADDLGVTRFCLTASIDYARERHQFGRAIGSFQALQHQLAETALALECAWAATYEAAWCFDARPADAARAAALAGAAAGDAALAAAELNQQLHAGIGFTWDDPAHLYLKRAKSNRLIWGHPDTHRGRLAQLLSLTAP